MTRDGEHPTLTAAFEAAARQYPDRLAVVDEENALTYAELASRADGIALRLAAGRAAPGLIGLSAERSVDLVAGILAILSAGSAYVPLDPGLPAQRLRFIAEDSGLTSILADDLTREFPAAVPVVPLTPLDGPDEARPPRVPAAAGPADPAYVIYTSGSTGVPKGVMVEHRQVLSLFAATAGLFSFGPDDVWSVLHSCSFDFSVWEIFGALLHGGCAVLASERTTRSPDELWGLLARESVTELSVTPSYFAQLAAADQGRADGLRHVFFGGEALDFAILKRWSERYGTAKPQLVNMYGITETTVHTTYHVIQPDEVSAKRSLIGRPLPHLQIRILDEDLREIPDGDTGEICVSGAGVARGYLGRPELTAQRFPSVNGVRLYRSGDLGRVLADDSIEYLGRLDEQLKIRGYRVEPGEIEHALRNHPDLADVAVISQLSAESGARLAAYVAPLPDRTVPSAASLRDFLAEVLPAYMIPSWFVPVDRLPVNHNGKLDRAALPEPGVAAARPAAPPEQPRSASALLAVWRDVLEDQGIGAHDRFYEVGGDSIQAIRVAAKARAAGLSVEVEDLIDNPTVESVITLLERRQEVSQEPQVGPGELLAAEDRGAIASGILDAYPLTALQLGMVYHGQASSGRLYHSVSRATVHLAFDAERMADCLRALAERHEILRTWFDLDGFSAPLQRVSARAEPGLRVVDLSGRPALVRDAELRALLDEEAAQPLDCGVAPMIRFAVAVLSPGEFVLIWAEAHAILDGWSSNGLFAELVSRYAGQPDPQRDVVVPPFRDYVAAERSAARDPAQRQFWASYLDGAPASGSAAASAEGSQLALDVPAGTSGRLLAAASAIGVPPASLFLAVVAAALSQRDGQPEVVVGHPSHGRLSRPGGELSAGLFLNTLPLRIRTTGSWREVAAAASAAQKATAPFRRYPLSAIQRAAGSGFRLGNLVNFTRFSPVELLTEAGLIGREGVANETWTSMPLLVDAESLVSGELAVTLQFRGAEWPDAAQTEFAGLLSDLLVRATSDVDAPAIADRAPGTPEADPAPEAAGADQAAARTEISLAQPEGSGEPGEPATAGRAAEESVPLRGADDELVAMVWQSILGIAPARRDDRFTDLGGDSLTAIRAVFGYAQQGIEVNAAELMERSTVAAQAALIATRRQAEPIAARGRDDDSR